MDYKVTKPEEFAEAKWRTVCNIGGHSFAPDILVHAAQGFLPISQLKINDKVLAYNEATQRNGYYPITAVHRHMDDSITTLKLQTEDGQFETLTTTPEHPFYVTIKAGNGIRPLPIGHEGLNEHWVGAGHLLIGDKLRLADGRVGEVRNVTTEAKTLEMFNLTVEQAHTFYVGTQGWLVHNAKDRISFQKLAGGSGSDFLNKGLHFNYGRGEFALHATLLDNGEIKLKIVPLGKKFGAPSVKEVEAFIKGNKDKLLEYVEAAIDQNQLPDISADKQPRFVKEARLVGRILKGKNSFFVECK